MNIALYFILAILGVIYLASWPIRIVAWKNLRKTYSATVVWLPSISGVLIIFVDIYFSFIKSSSHIFVPWGLIFLFVHSILFVFGIVYSIRYRTFCTRIAIPNDLDK